MSTTVQSAGRILAERLGLTIHGTEGHDLTGPCIECNSSDAFRVHQETGVAFCHSCRKNWSAWDVALKHLGDRGQTMKLLVELGLRESSNGHANGESNGVDPLLRIAQEKGVSVDGLKVYGATVAGGAVVLPMYDADGKQCSTFTMRPGEGKGKNAHGKPSGVFLPHDGGEVRRPGPGEPWIIVEGPKDAAACCDLGFDALGLPTSEIAAKFARLFNDADVIVVGDLDTAGQNGSQKTASRLWGHAKTVRVARLPGDFKAKGGDDLRDVLRKPNGRELALKAFREARPWQPIVEADLDHAAPGDIVRPESRTDSANAKRIAAEYGDCLRWCDPWGRFLIFDGKRWAIDKTRNAEALAKNIGQQVWTEVGQLLPKLRTDGLGRELLAFAKASANAKGVRDMLALVRSEPRIPALPEQLDQDQWALNVVNGTIDLRTKNLRPHRRDDYITKLCPVEFNEGADCPLWCRFIEEITDGNRGLAAFLRRMVGFSLTGTTREHILLFLYGTGSNGKSTFLSTILELLGTDYAMKAAPELLMAKKGQTHPTELADLHGKRFVACVETEDGRRLAESLVKELTGGDKVRARRMREDFWEFTATHKVWLAGNHRPAVRGTDHGIWRRIKLVPFTVTIPDERQDKDLPGKLLTELSGILNWALIGCLEWQVDGLGEPDEVKLATAEYRGEMDLIGRFIGECCLTGEGCRAKASDLYAAYRQWADRSGENAISQVRFGQSLVERERKFTRYTNNGTWYRGLALNGEPCEGTSHETTKGV